MKHSLKGSGYFSFLLSLLLPPTLSIIVLPRPPSIYNTHLEVLELVDHSRVDPSAPCCNEPRRLMISIFSPARCDYPITVPYMPPKTAAYYNELFAPFGLPNDTMAQFLLQTCDVSVPRFRSPLAIFSPGLGLSRLIYSDMMQWIASTGIRVVAIDHPFDADIVEFPDGKVIMGNVTGETDLIQKLATRVKDVSFVLDRLSHRDISIQNNPSRPAGLSRRTAAVFGHSFGGATAANVLFDDDGFAGGLDMDGFIFPAALNTSSHKPFMLVAAEGRNQSSDTSWAAYWKKLEGWKLQIEVDSTRHFSFTDLSILAKLVGIDPTKQSAVGDLIGTIDGVRILEILRPYVGEFLSLVLRGEKADLLKGESEEFPEVGFQNASSTEA